MQDIITKNVVLSVQYHLRWWLFTLFEYFWFMGPITWAGSLLFWKLEMNLCEISEICCIHVG